MQPAAARAPACAAANCRTIYSAARADAPAAAYCSRSCHQPSDDLLPAAFVLQPADRMLGDSREQSCHVGYSGYGSGSSSPSAIAGPLAMAVAQRLLAREQVHQRDVADVDQRPKQMIRQPAQRDRR